MTEKEFERDMYESQVAAAAEKRLEEFLNDDRAIAQHLAKRNAYLVQRVEEVETERDMIAEDLTRLTDSEGNYEMKDAAKLLKYKRADGKQVGRTELFAFLRAMQFLNRNNTPAQSAVDNGWCDEVTGTYVRKGVEQNYVKTVVTPKGLDRIRRLTEDAFDDWWEGR